MARLLSQGLQEPIKFQGKGALLLWIAFTGAKKKRAPMDFPGHCSPTEIE
jgi:hypothetical protein